MISGNKNTHQAQSPAAPIAIIGMGCLFPKADGPGAYWANIKKGVDAITEVPPSHWDVEDYFDRDPDRPDCTYAKTGGFLSPVAFNPLEFGIAPNDLEATDTTQLLGLVVSKRALQDAGYGEEREFDRERVSVILGVTGTLELVIPLGARLGHPIWRRALQKAGISQPVAEDVIREIASAYPDWQENSFPGLLGNVVAGRIANKLDLRGTNCVVDAACASSLSALHLAQMELATGRCDMVISGGMDTFNDIFMYMCFSKTPALSPSGHARPFDARADGTILGEGLGVLVLKRLEDAERDGDRVYAVLLGVGSSSDGRGSAIYAPSDGGQARALRNAYETAGVTPDTVELLEAHGTGTRVGDATELRALTEVYRGFRSEGVWCALGSVKSQIGHTKAAAGIAGIIKNTLGLYHKVLPPTIKVERPNDYLQHNRTPFYLNTTPRPWFAHDDHPRRAAVSAFGFGGSNFHCVLEEFQREKAGVEWDDDIQILPFASDAFDDLVQGVERLHRKAWDEIVGMAWKLRETFQSRSPYRLVMVLERRHLNLDNLIGGVRSLLKRNRRKASWSTPDGIYFAQGNRAGKLAVLFPGQGSQYPGMLRDLCCHFPEMFATLEAANRIFPAVRYLSDRIYPHPVFSDEEAHRQVEALQDTSVAQPAIGAVSLGAFKVLERFGVRPDAVAGHSYGELTALRVSGCMDDASFMALSKLRGDLMQSRSREDAGTMLAVQAPLHRMEEIIKEESLDLVIANRNAPDQSVLSGRTGEIDRAMALLTKRGIRNRPLRVSRAFHSPLVEEAGAPFAQALGSVLFEAQTMPVYSNATGQVYPKDTCACRVLLSRQIARPVLFMEMIERMYRAEVRTFLEVGPHAKISGLVRSILDGRRHHSIALDSSTGRRSGIADLGRALAQLACLGYPVRLSGWGDAPKAAASGKPALEIALSGANYVQTRTGDEGASGKQAAAATEIHGREKRTTAREQPDAETADDRPHGTVEPAVHSTMLSESRPDETPTATPMTSSRPSSQPMERAVLQRALQLTQENMLALKKIQEETARLHEKYLEGQQESQHIFQTLIAQQERLLGHAVDGDHALRATETAPAWTPEAASQVEAASCALPEPAPQQVDTPMPTPAPVPVADARSVRDAVAQTLLEVVSEKTGYPVDMLNLEMELDADLGIDSIKRVEILSALEEVLPDAGGIEPGQLGAIRTLQDVAMLLDASPDSEAEADRPVQTVPASMESMLLEVVSEKTGYPVDMLNLEMELDADLGIDSIKRVEILSALEEKRTDGRPIAPETLAGIRSLQDVLDQLQQDVAVRQRPARDAHHVAPAVPFPGNGKLRRSVLSSVKLVGKPTDRIVLPTNATIWMNEDGSELSLKLRDHLHALGYQTRLIPLDGLDDIAPAQTLAGLVILPDRQSMGLSFLVQAFQLIQLAAPGLRRCGRQSGSLLITVSCLDGAFGLGEMNGGGIPASAGLAGIAKTASHEWQEVHCKAIDLSPRVTDDPALAAGMIANEMFVTGPLEVGLCPHGRYSLELIPSELNGEVRTLPIARGDVVMVSGGARGVTAETAVKLAAACSPVLLILGRTSIEEAEPDWLAGLQDEGAIKAAIAQHAQDRPDPRTVRRRYRQIIARREIRRNLSRMEHAGATVLYRAVDIRDEAALQGIVRDIRRRYGPVKGILHGAGVIADKLIEEKTREQFHDVLSTKVDGLQSMLNSVQTASLRFLALFSSTTGRYGRKGQADYAAANEILNKFAQIYARRMPSCRVLAVNWGPWAGGMVTPPLRRLFEQEGVDLIPLEAGAAYLLEEISTAPGGPVEVVIMGCGHDTPSMPRGRGADRVVQDPPAFFPALECELDVEGHAYLRSHVIDGRAVLPVAMMVEWLSHGAMHANPGLDFHGFNDLRVHKGVKLDSHTRVKVRVEVGKIHKQDDLFLVPARLCTVRDNHEVIHHAACDVVLAASLPQGNGGVMDERLNKRRDPRDNGDIYQDRLFHGHHLHGLSEIQYCFQDAMVATSRTAPSPSDWQQHPLRQEWLADPLALDSSFQMVILWSFEQYQAGSLPCFAGKYRQYAKAFPRDQVKIFLRIKQDTPQKAVADIDFLDSAHRLVARMEDCECVIDQSLNRAFLNNRLAHGSGIPAEAG